MVEEDDDEAEEDIDIEDEEEDSVEVQPEDNRVHQQEMKISQEQVVEDLYNSASVSQDHHQLHQHQLS